MHATETRTQPASRHSRIPSLPGLLTAIAGLACVPAALAQYTFTGRVAVPPNSPRNWFDIGTDNTPCGVTPFGTIQYNNWGQEWCSQSPPSNLIPPNGTFNLAGFDIVAFNDTRASLVTNPGGGRFRTGNGTHSWGMLTLQRRFF